MQDESLQMTDLSARISFVSARAGLTIVEQNRLPQLFVSHRQIAVCCPTGCKQDFKRFVYLIFHTAKIHDNSRIFMRTDENVYESIITSISQPFSSDRGRNQLQFLFDPSICLTDIFRMAKRK